MPKTKTCWAIINDTPTECTIQESLYNNLWLLRPVGEQEDCVVTVLNDYVHEDKASCIQQAIEILRRYHKDSEEEVKKVLLYQSQLLNKIKQLEKELEEPDETR